MLRDLRRDSIYSYRGGTGMYPFLCLLRLRDRHQSHSYADIAVPPVTGSDAKMRDEKREQALRRLSFLISHISCKLLFKHAHHHQHRFLALGEHALEVFAGGLEFFIGLFAGSAERSEFCFDVGCTGAVILQRGAQFA